LRRGALLRDIGRAARRRGVEWILVRQGGRHELWRCGATEVVIPRHAGINDLTALGVKRVLENELGKGWWR
jgi:mRNA interferase HicA